MTDKKDPLDPSNLELSLSDFAYSSAKGGIGGIPFVGSFLSEVFSLSKDSPFEKRKKEFILALSNKLEQLSKQSRIDINSLKSNAEFQDIILQSYEIALKNSQKEKLELIQNVVINSALGMNITHDEKLIFLDILNRITPSHYRVLLLWHSPESWLLDTISKKYSITGKSKTDYLVWPDILNDVLKYDVDFFQVVIQDLITWNLINKGDSRIHLDEDPETLYAKWKQNFNVWQKNFGREFLDFVKSPTL